MDEAAQQKLPQITIEELQVEKDISNELYLNAKEQENRRIAFIHCENHCGLVLEFKYPNSTFFFCKGHGAAINLDLNGVPAAGVSCGLHGKMERYDLVKDDNVCPRCENTTLAIVSVGRDRGK